MDDACKNPPPSSSAAAAAAAQAATQHKNPDGMTKFPDLLGQSTY
jgi:hypothetical protein